MYERKRRAIDVSGHRVELIERGELPFDETLDGAKHSTSTQRNMFTPDGQPLIDDGEDFFRNPFGRLYKILDKQ